MSPYNIRSSSIEELKRRFRRNRRMNDSDLLCEVIRKAKELKEFHDLCTFLDKVVCVDIDCDKCPIGKRIEELKNDLIILLRSV